MEMAARLIRYSTGTTMVAFGLSQIFRPRPWLAYMPGWLRRLMPVDELMLMRLHGGGNLILGLWLMLGAAPKLAAWVCLAWWTSIWPFAAYYDWRDGLRDMTIIAGMVALLWLW